MTNPRPKFLDNHIANQIPFAGLERARGGRLLFLLHQPHVRHQVLFFNQNNSTAIRIAGTSSSRPWTTPPVGSRPLWPDLQRGSNQRKAFLSPLRHWHWPSQAERGGSGVSRHSERAGRCLLTRWTLQIKAFVCLSFIIPSIISCVFFLQGIKMQYFAFRWLSLLLSQVFFLKNSLNFSCNAQKEGECKPFLTFLSRYTGVSPSWRAQPLGRFTHWSNQVDLNIQEYCKLGENKTRSFFPQEWFADTNLFSDGLLGECTWFYPDEE